MSEKQTTFFTVNCAGKLESPNQCYPICPHLVYNDPNPTQIIF
jgi:hypothetical protein